MKLIKGANIMKKVLKPISFSDQFHMTETDFRCACENLDFPLQDIMIDYYWCRESLKSLSREYHLPSAKIRTLILETSKNIVYRYSTYVNPKNLRRIEEDFDKKTLKEVISFINMLPQKERDYCEKYYLGTTYEGKKALAIEFFSTPRIPRAFEESLALRRLAYEEQIPEISRKVLRNEHIYYQKEELKHQIGCTLPTTKGILSLYYYGDDNYNGTQIAAIMGVTPAFSNFVLKRQKDDKTFSKLVHTTSYEDPEQVVENLRQNKIELLHNILANRQKQLIKEKTN